MIKYLILIVFLFSVVGCYQNNRFREPPNKIYTVERLVVYMTHESKWIADKQCWRLVHPETGDFIAEYYPFTNQLVVTKHRKTATIKLDEYQLLKNE